MSIVTFYSYKGGVGRSLALANVAMLLARDGARVLAIDWDLEAPGLEEYFDDFRVNADGRGLLFLLRDRGNFAEHVWRLYATDSDASLDLLPSGRDERDYYPALERFNQENFFAEGGGDFLEALREEWLARYDYVLIDSRTGLSDAGGVCTIQLPDIVVGMFTATRQSVRGVRDVLELAQGSRQNLAYTRPQFSVIPVPCRINTSDETGDLKQWMQEFANAMESLTADWRPKSLSIETILHALTVEHDGALTHGTRIIQGTNGGHSLQVIGTYQRIAALIKSDLSDLQVVESSTPSASLSKETKAFVEGIDAVKQIAKTTTSKMKDITVNTKKMTEYHTYFSVPSGSVEARWVEDFFLPVFQSCLQMHLGEQPQIFFHRSELSAGESWSSIMQDAVRASATMLAFVSARSVRSEWVQRENSLFMEKQRQGLIVPVRLSDEPLPKELQHMASADLMKFFVTGSVDSYKDSDFWKDFVIEVDRLAEGLALFIKSEKK